MQKLAYIFICMIVLNSPARAHVVLLDSMKPRSSDDNIKPSAGDLDNKPCGDPSIVKYQPTNDDSKRTVIELKDDPANFGKAGYIPTTLEIKWKETINHNSEYQISYSSGVDENGDPMEDVYNVILVDKSVVQDKAGGEYSQVVEIPPFVCDRCSIQLIQDMDSGVGLSPTQYVSCMDIKVVARSTDGGNGNGNDQTPQDNSSTVSKPKTPGDVKFKLIPKSAQ